MIGRSMSSAWITTRVATRFGFGFTVASAVSDGEAPGGGKVGRVSVGAGSAEIVVLGSGEPDGAAAEALPARLSTPAESRVTPVAVSTAGRRRSRRLRPRVVTDGHPSSGSLATPAVRRYWYPRRACDPA